MAELDQDEFPVRHYGIREIAGRIRPLLRRQVRRLVTAMVLVTIAGMSQAVGPMFGRFIIDEAIPAKSLRLACFAGGVFLVLQLIWLGLWFGAQMLVLHVSEDVVYGLRSLGFRHLNRLCMRFHGRFSSGFIHDRVFERSICSIGGFLSFLFANLSVYVCGLVFALVLCLWLSPLMSMVIMIGAIGYVFVSRRLAPRIYRSTLDANDAHNTIHGFILDKLRGTKTIQAYALEEQVERDFDSRVEPVKNKWLRAQWEIRRLHLLTQCLSIFITTVVYVMGAWLVMDRGVSIGTLVAFIGYQAQFISFVSQLANMQSQVSIARAGFDQFYTVMDTLSTVREQPAAKLPETITGELQLDHVTFAYEGKPVLQDLQLTVPPGQTVALVGRSGSGKSTITNLLLRFYDPDHGTVRLDGQDIRELPVRAYRSLYGVVLQEPFLFNDSVAANLRCARPDASDADLLAALERAQALDFIWDSPLGMQLEVGEGGCRLSGGQRQRIAIARCLLTQPRFLILDEATSALDNESEQLVQRALDALFENRTAFIIAHRLSTIRRADRILVLDQGRIVEEGNFDSLIAADGLFAHFHRIATSSSLHEVKLSEAGFA